MKNTALIISMSLLTIVLSATYAAADVAIGDKGPAWTKLPGTDGKEHSLSDLKDAKVVVVAFTCNRCPVAIDYEDRFIQFAKDYQAKGAVFVAIDCSGDTLDEMKARAQEKDFNFAFLADESQEIGKKFGAVTTPHVFILDKSRNVAYMGAFDNNKANGIPYVRNAVDALLDGKPVEVSKTQQFGCRIFYSN